MKKYYCYAFVPGNPPGERVGIVEYGLMGYVTTNCDHPLVSEEQIKAVIAEFNEKSGVPAEVAESMMAGSMFGWHTPAAQLAAAWVKAHQEPASGPVH